MRIWANRHRSLASKRVLLWVTLGIGVVLIFFLISIHGFSGSKRSGWGGSPRSGSLDPCEDPRRIRNCLQFRALSLPLSSWVALCRVAAASPMIPRRGADLAARRLARLGFDTKKLVQITCPPCRPAVPSRVPQRLNAGSAVRGSPFVA